MELEMENETVSVPRNSAERMRREKGAERPDLQGREQKMRMGGCGWVGGNSISK